MKISVYIPSYNQPAYLVEAIDSVLAQTLLPHEIIIVDDASSDDSPDVIRAYASRHPDLIKPVFHEQNTGIAGVRNDAIAAATGSHISYVDGDDRFLPGKLEKEADALVKNPDAELAFSNYYNMTETGDRTDAWIDAIKPPEGDLFEAVFSRMLPRRDTFRFELVSLEAVRNAGPYDTSLKIYEDFDFKIRLMKKTKACYVYEALAERRCHASGLSNAKAEAHFETLCSIYRKNRALLHGIQPEARRSARRMLLNWIAGSAVTAGRYSLNDASRGFLNRRCAALRCFFFCAAYAPDLLSFGDLYRLLLPARSAERLSDGTVGLAK